MLRAAVRLGPVCGILLLMLSACGRGPAPARHSDREAGPVPASFALRYDSLAPALANIEEADRDTIADTIGLIKKGEHTLALERLSALNARTPDNSSLRILTSYALLQTGNLLGAFEEAEKAHQTPQRLSYKCWFLAKVSLITGHKEMCERELAHLRSVGEVASARELEQEFAQEFGSAPKVE